ncbi:MAG TPA: TIM barrel protein [Actinopolymorphaceae bacterium]
MIDLGALTGRVAGAPISWGVCEAPGWGFELPADTVLAEMAMVGLAATELGPTGYLGSGPEAVKETLAKQDLRLVGGFLPVVMHQVARADLTDAETAMSTLAAAGADVVVLSADAGPDGYDRKLVLSDEAWGHLVHNLERLRQIAGDHGLRATLHPHVGTAVETAAAVSRLLDASDIQLCLDTGHLIIGGTDPVDLARSAPERIGHVHLKDVRLDVASGVATGAVGFLDAVRNGLFAPLGEGDVDIAAIVAALEGAGYAGWYVMEQDTALSGPVSGGEPGPVEDVRRSLGFLERLGH